MKRSRDKESGVALITVLLMLLLFTSMMLGFYYLATSEMRIAGSDRDNSVAYYGAEAGLERMSSDLAAWFVFHAAPTPAQIDGLTAASYIPNIPGVTFPCGGTPPPCQGYTITYQTNADGTLKSTVGQIGGSGPLQGLQGIITPFTLGVIARGPNGSEVKLTRQVQEVAVPVFQFGIFSDSDLSFFAGPDFNFGGRVHTNGYLYVTEGDGSTLTLGDRVTVFKEVIRNQLSNGLLSTSSDWSYDGTVNVLVTGPSTYHNLTLSEGSLTGGPSSSANSNWKNISLNTCKGNIKTKLTGARQLNLAIALAGATPIDTIRRAPPGESAATTVGSERFFNQASLRISLSDNAATLTGLPGATSTAPYPLAEAGSTGTSGTGTDKVQRTSGTSAYYLPATGACNPPMATSPGWSADHDYMSPINTTLLGGYIKIEIQLNSNPGTWQDVTKEILSLGISSDVAAGGMAGPPHSRTNTAPNNLNASTTYYYTVTALGAWGESGGSEVSQATSSSNKAINLNWGTAVPGATGYKVYRSITSGQYNSGTGNGYVVLTVGTARTGWASPWTSYTDTGGAVTWGTPPPACTNNSILHLEEAGPGVTLTSSNVTTSTNFVPINIYDAREGEVRDTTNSTSTPIALGGVMNIVEIDVQNLQKWFANTLDTVNAPSGALALNQSGYILYFSDRRGNNTDTAHLPIASVTGSETAEYGYEDNITSSSSSTGSPNGGTPDTAEDVNGNGVLDTYGGTPHYLALDSSGTTKYPVSSSTTTLQTFVPGFTPTNGRLLGVAAGSRITGSQGQKNSVIFFRHALRLVNGQLGYLPPLPAATCTAGASGGFTVAAENPIYVQGDYNASVANGFSDTSSLCHVPAAVIGDAVTLLSNAWTTGAQSGNGDANSFAYPSDRSNRDASANTWYRMGIFGGKNLSFSRPTGYTTYKDFGTDGGTHNFLRYLEDWGSATSHYRGSMVSFYISRQATGIYKCCTTVYNAPGTRDYAFDTDFQNISKLPPGTPRFTDVNALSYKQVFLPNQ